MIIEHVYRLDRMIFKYRRGWSEINALHEEVYTQVDRIHRHLTTGLNLNGFVEESSLIMNGGLAHEVEEPFGRMQDELQDLQNCINEYEEVCGFFTFFSEDKESMAAGARSAQNSPAKGQ